MASELQLETVLSARDTEIASLQFDLGCISSRLGVAYHPDAGLPFPIDDVCDAIANILEAKDLKAEIALLKTTIKGFEAALELANEKVGSITSGSYTQLMQAGKAIQDRDRQVEELQLENRRLRVENGGLKDEIASGYPDHELNVASQLVAAKQVIEERDRELKALKANYEALDRQSRINLELRSESNVTLESYQEVLDTLRSLFNLPLKRNYLDLPSEVASLKQTIADREGEIADLNLALECVKKNNLSRKTQLEERDRKILILEDNLNRARSEHLEQLRAIIQMLQPLIGRPYNSTEQKDGKTYVHVNYTNEFTHNEKNVAIKLIQKVVYANVKRLDPCIKATSYDDDF